MHIRFIINNENLMIDCKRTLTAYRCTLVNSNFQRRNEIYL